MKDIKHEQDNSSAREKKKKKENSPPNPSLENIFERKLHLEGRCNFKYLITGYKYDSGGEEIAA